jgi:hypothetical protein
MKMRLDALGTAKNESGHVKHETRTDALGTAENESGSPKYEIETRCPPYRRKCARERKILKLDPMPTIPPKMSPGVQNMKTGYDTIDTTENMSGSAKHENESRRPSHRQKHVRERKT